MIMLFIAPFGFPFSIYWSERDRPQVETSVLMASADSAQARRTRDRFQGPSRLVDGLGIRDGSPYK